MGRFPVRERWLLCALLVVWAASFSLSIRDQMRDVGVSPILSDLRDKGRVRFEAATDREVIDALSLTLKMEGLVPALESTHAFVQAFKEAPDLGAADVIIINQSGRGDKDIFTVADAFEDPKWREFIRQKAEEYDAR